MFSFRVLIVLLCLTSLLLVAGCRNSAPKKVQGPNGVTLQRGQMSKQQKEDYGKVMLEQKRRQGKAPAQPK
ncbi:MAG: hypothetical protein ACYDCO_20405 [Armatimonadota bacterium]